MNTISNPSNDNNQNSSSKISTSQYPAAYGTPGQPTVYVVQHYREDPKVSLERYLKFVIMILIGFSAAGSLYMAYRLAFVFNSSPIIASIVILEGLRVLLAGVAAAIISNRKNGQAILANSTLFLVFGIVLLVLYSFTTPKVEFYYVYHIIVSAVSVFIDMVICERSYRLKLLYQDMTASNTESNTESNSQKI